MIRGDARPHAQPPEDTELLSLRDMAGAGCRCPIGLWPLAGPAASAEYWRPHTQLKQKRNMAKKTKITLLIDNTVDLRSDISVDNCAMDSILLIKKI